MKTRSVVVMPTGVGRLLFDPDGGRGWATHQTDDGPVVQLRFQERPDGRIGVAEVHVIGDGLTGTDLRSIPLGRIEATVNRPSAQRQIREHLLRKGPAYNPDEMAPIVSPDVFAPARRPSLRLRIPAIRKRPDEFYERVAELYTYLAGPGGSARPAADIAEANGVPATTVHRWVKEARARGLLAGGERPAYPQRPAYPWGQSQSKKITRRAK